VVRGGIFGSHVVAWPHRETRCVGEGPPGDANARPRRPPRRTVERQASFVAAAIAAVHAAHCARDCPGVVLAGHSMGSAVSRAAVATLEDSGDPARRRAASAVRLLLSLAGPSRAPPLDLYPSMRALFRGLDARREGFFTLAISLGDRDVQVRPWHVAGRGAPGGGGRADLDARLVPGAWASVHHDAVWANQLLGRLARALRCAAPLLAGPAARAGWRCPGGPAGGAPGSLGEALRSVMAGRGPAAPGSAEPPPRLPAAGGDAGAGGAAEPPSVLVARAVGGAAPSCGEGLGAAVTDGDGWEWAACRVPARSLAVVRVHGGAGAAVATVEPGGAALCRSQGGVPLDGGLCVRGVALVDAPAATPGLRGALEAAGVAEEAILRHGITGGSQGGSALGAADLRAGGVVLVGTAAGAAGDGTRVSVDPAGGLAPAFDCAPGGACAAAGAGRPAWGPLPLKAVLGWAPPAGAAGCAPPTLLLLGERSEVLATARLPPAGLGAPAWARLAGERALGRLSASAYRRAVVGAALDAGTYELSSAAAASLAAAARAQGGAGAGRIRVAAVGDPGAGCALAPARWEPAVTEWAVHAALDHRSGALAAASHALLAAGLLQSALGRPGGPAGPGGRGVALGAAVLAATALQPSVGMAAAAGAHAVAFARAPRGRGRGWLLLWELTQVAAGALPLAAVVRAAAASVAAGGGLSRVAELAGLAGASPAWRAAAGGYCGAASGPGGLLWGRGAGGAGGGGAAAGLWVAAAQDWLPCALGPAVAARVWGLAVSSAALAAARAAAAA